MPCFDASSSVESVFSRPCARRSVLQIVPPTTAQNLPTSILGSRTVTILDSGSKLSTRSAKICVGGDFGTGRHFTVKPDLPGTGEPRAGVMPYTGLGDS